MKLREWDYLPAFMKCDEVREYYDILEKRKGALALKRIFDVAAACIMLVILAVPMLIIAIIIKLDSPGAVFYRQERITAYGKRFRIHKFRTMVNNAEKNGTNVTAEGDKRITKVGRKLRRFRIDEIPQLIDVIAGNMSFVGTRPEVAKYVGFYSNEMYATLLLPAGITSEASIRYKDEGRLLNVAEDVDSVYIKKILPEKMKWNLESIRQFRFLRDILTIFRTIFAVLGKDYE